MSLKCTTAAAAIIIAAGLQPAEAATRSADVVLATPPSITLQRAGEGGSGVYTGGGAFVDANGRKMVFGTADGRTLYFSDKDAPGKSNCNAECATTWLPAVAPAGAKPVGRWTIITRDDGKKQWAYDNKPLYSNSKETKPAELTGNNAENGTWHQASYDLNAGRALPYGLIKIGEIAEANGQGLLTSEGLTLYTLDGKDDKAGPCKTAYCPKFTAYAAPLLLKPVGDFTIVDRADGSRQWAFKGKPLYTYEADKVRGDVNGLEVDKRFQVALLETYFMPDEIKIEATRRGNLLADKKGKLVYRQEGFTYITGAGTNMHRFIPPRPNIGREIGWQSCMLECLTDWQPVKAPANAQPQGYWEIATRDDGTRQWVYQGYALYTYNKEGPNQITGSERHIFFVSDDPNKEVKIPTQMGGAGAIYWMYNAP